MTDWHASVSLDVIKFKSTQIDSRFSGFGGASASSTTAILHFFLGGTGTRASIAARSAAILSATAFSASFFVGVHQPGVKFCESFLNIFSVDDFMCESQATRFT